MVMRLLVTGASGFIGKHVINFLPDYITTHFPPKNECNLLDENNIDYLIRELRPTHCLHLAWLAGEGYLNSKNNQDWLDKSKYLIKNFYKNGGVRFIGVGTCYEYTDSTAPHTEYEACQNGITIYGKAKLALSVWLRNYAKKNGFSWAWARPFFITGPGEKNARFIPGLITSLINNDKFMIRYSNRILDYMDVRDIASALCKLITSDKNGLFNISSGCEISLRNLANKLIYLGRFDNNVEFGTDIFRPMYCVGDNSRLLNIINFKPKYSLEQTLLDSIAYIKRNN